MLSDELNDLDTDLKELFVGEKYDEIMDLLVEISDSSVKELSDHNWTIIKKYYDTEKFTLLMQHIKYVAYTCFLVEYAHKRGIIGEDVFGIMMLIYNDINELNKQQKK
ncbi:MAG TPA: hypothetical protein VJ888_08045 [Mobilitalea sp.]|nr:hypothetical protein [Mobilitalea sp.]